jgi:hypothetical protein
MSFSLLGSASPPLQTTHKGACWQVGLLQLPPVGMSIPHRCMMLVSVAQALHAWNFPPPVSRAAVLAPLHHPSRHHSIRTCCSAGTAPL